MSQKLTVNGFEWVKYISSINKKLKTFTKIIKNYDEDSDKGYTFEVDVEYPKNFLHSDLQFLHERMKINQCNKLLCNLYDEKNYVIHIRALKQIYWHGYWT